MTLTIRRAALLFCLTAGFMSVGPAQAEVTLQRFSQVSEGVFRGSRPSTDDDFEYLKAHGIKQILSVERMPWNVWPEREQALKRGLKFEDISIDATPWEPSEGSVNAAIAFISDPAHWPVYLHCMIGRDRTGMIVALYRIFSQGWSPDAAYQEWESFGYHHTWYMRGLEEYFEDHKDRPVR